MFNKIKSLIVKLRRNIEPVKNFKEFNFIIKNNIDEIIKTFNVRWLISICDTYADYGKPNEAKNALIISILINSDRFASTRLHISKDSSVDINKLNELDNYRIKNEFWGGLTYYHINKGDAIYNLFKRIHALVSDTPIIYKIFTEIINRMQKENNVKSLYKYMNDNNSINKHLSIK